MNITQLLGSDFPIIQAPMAGIQGSAMAIAVSNAGGLGSLPCATLTPDGIAQELRAITQATSRPYNVNFFCHQQPIASEAAELAWRQALAPYYAEFSIDPQSVKSGAGRLPFDQACADVLAEFKPRIVSFHFGLPDIKLLDQIRSWGGKILSSATTVSEAIWLKDQGVDAIIAQGLEAGGHRGMFLTNDLTTQVSTFALVPQIKQVVSVPVIATGGIADAEGVAAAMQLGADAVQVGTSYMLCDEAFTSAWHRKALASDAAKHTALTNIFTGRPARGIVNRVMRELGLICISAPQFPLATAALAPIRVAAEAKASGEFSSLWSGQNATGCKAISAALMTQQLARGL